MHISMKLVSNQKREKFGDVQKKALINTIIKQTLEIIVYLKNLNQIQVYYTIHYFIIFRKYKFKIVL